MLRLFVKIWLSLLLVPTIALASNLECYEEEGTMSTMCIQPAQFAQMAIFVPRHSLWVVQKA